MVFNGTSAQSVSFSGPGPAAGNAHFQDVTFANAAGVNFASYAQINGSATIDANIPAATVTSNAGVVVTIGANLTDTVGGGWQVAGTTFSGVNPNLPDSLTTNLNFTNSASLSSGFTLSGNLSVTGSSGNLNLNTQTISITGNFSTAGSGVLSMTEQSDVFNIGGDVNFSGGQTDTLLTAGTLQVGGTFYGYYGSFAASGTHRVTFNGGSAQTVSFSGPGPAPGNAHFQDVAFANPSGVAFFSNAQVNGSATIDANVPAAIVSSNPAYVVTIVGSLIDTVGGRWQVAGTTFSGINPELPTALSTNLSFTNSAVLSSGFTLTGNLTVTGSSGNLALNARTVSISGNMNTSGSGVLTMTDPSDIFTVGGNIDFSGGQTDTLLTAGTLNVAGTFYGYYGSFAASGTHRVVFNGTSSQTVSFSGAGPAGNNAHFQDVTIANPAGVVLTNVAQFNGSVTIDANVPTATVTSSFANVNVAGSLNDTVGGRWQATNTYLTGIDPALPATLTTNLNVSNSAALSSGFNLTGNLRVIGNSGNLDINAQTVTISGDFSTAQSGVLTMTDPAGRFNVNGDVDFGGGQTDTLLTAGTINVSGETFYGYYGTFAASGTHRVVFNGTSTQTVSFSGPGPAGNNAHFQDVTFANPAGVIFGANVQINGNVLNAAGSLLNNSNHYTLTVVGLFTNAGVISPGLSPARLTISGPFTQETTGAINIEISGTTPASQYDQLVINGNANLAGSLNVSLIDGFVPTVGNSFNLISYTSHLGTFDTVNLPNLAHPMGWTFTTGPSAVGLEVINVDTDDDQMDDDWEIANFGDLTQDGSGDADGDLLSDLEEFNNNADPNNADTDNDGYYDHEEVQFGSDLNSPQNVPVFNPGVYFVDANATNVGDGSAGAPWQVLHHAVHVINGGSPGNYLLNILPGLYTSTDNNGNEPDETLIVMQDNVNIVGSPGTILEGIPSQSAIWENGLEIAASNISVIGLEIRDFYFELSRGIRVSQGSNIVIQQCIIHGNNDGIAIENTGNGTVVTDSTIYNHNLNGIYVDGSNPQIYGNSLYDNVTGVMISEYSSNSISALIFNNLIFETAAGSAQEYGIFLEAVSSGSTISAQIYHNVIYGSLFDAISIYEEQPDSPDIGIKFNIITNSNDTAIRINGASPDMDYNCYWGNLSDISGGVPGSGSLFSDPLFVNTLVNDFHLQNGSPVIDAIPVNAGDPIGFDFDLTPRPQGAGFDMGAYEYPAETTPPVLVSVQPAADADDVALNATVFALFSENINPTSVDSVSFFLVDESDAPVPGTYTVVNQGITFTPDAPFQGGTTYTATLTTGISDMAGNNLGAGYTWSFTTLFNDPPTVVATQPADGSVDVSLSSLITVTFSEDILPQSVSGQSFSISDGISNLMGTIQVNANTVTFTPQNDLIYGATYTVLVTTAVQDFDGESMASDVVWSFTTLINTPPLAPPAIGPIDESNIDAIENIVLNGGDYVDIENHQHLETNWQVRRADSGELLIDEVSTVDFTQYMIASQTLPSGLKYIWQVGYTDEFGDASWSEERSFKIGTSENDENVQVVSGTEVASYRMVSFVQYPDDPRAEAVFGDDLTGDYSGNYRIGTYNAAQSSYDEYGNGTLTVEPGRAYWFMARDGLDTVVEGVPVSLDTEIYVALYYNPNTQDGWNMVGPPNQSNYLWGDVQVVVDDGQALTPVGSIAGLADDNPYIDRHLWRWEDGIYNADTPDTDPSQTMAAYSGYWVRAKRTNVLLRFDPSVQQASQSSIHVPMARLWNKLSTRLAHIDIFIGEAVAVDNDSPPQPMGGLEDENEVDPVIEGCFILSMGNG